MDGVSIFTEQMILYRDPFGIVPIVEPVIISMGYDLWGVECHTGIKVARVCIYIDRSQGVTLDDCSRVSQQLSAVMDVEDPIDVPYTLEVSSPGINRPLFSIEQMRGTVGSKVKIKTLWLIEERRNICGILEEVQDEEIKVKVDANKSLTVPTNAIKNIKLDTDIKINN